MKRLKLRNPNLGEIDYADKLNSEYLKWITDFNKAIANGEFDTNQLSFSQEEKREIWNALYAAKNDILNHSRKVTIEHEHIEAGIDLGSLVDAAKKRKAKT